MGKRDEKNSKSAEEGGVVPGQKHSTSCDNGDVVVGVEQHFMHEETSAEAQQLWGRGDGLLRGHELYSENEQVT